MSANSLQLRDLLASTRRLLWATNADPSLAIGQSTIYVKLILDEDGVSSETHDPTEPSLIFTKLPVRRPRDPGLVSGPGYSPSYAELSPEQRWLYLDWLRDPRRPIDLGFVFIYFYGLERHLVFDAFDAAVQEICLLLEHHSKKTFPQYARCALAAGGIFRNRYDIFDRLPWILEDPDSVSLWVKLHLNHRLSPNSLIDLRSCAKFHKTTYLKKYPERFLQVLTRVMDEDERSHRCHVLKRFPQDSLPKVKMSVFANRSLPRDITDPEVPDILSYRPFLSEIHGLLERAHETLKAQLAAERKLIRRVPFRRRQLTEGTKGTE
jgi:hypothetical protein